MKFFDKTSIIDKLYIVMQILFISGFAFSGFMLGFRNMIGNYLILLIFPITVIVLVLSIIYWIIVIVQQTKKKKRKIIVPIILTLIAILFHFQIDHFRTYYFYKIGVKTAYLYAGLDNIRRDADQLMASAGKESVLLNRNKYPESFRKVGSFRINYSQDSLRIFRIGEIGSKQGIIVHSTNYNYPFGTESCETPVAPRIFHFRY